jgi:glycosyltransferase involved in cell wall biosynthesis
MNLLISLEQRFLGTSDGSVWDGGTYAEAFWRRYLEVFERVTVLARVRMVTEVPAGHDRANGRDVEFLAVPHYIGPAQFVRKWFRIKRVLAGAVNGRDAVIMRVPSVIASCLYPQLCRSDRPYGVEVVGDPYDMFAPGAVKHPLRPLFRRWYHEELRRHCANACGAAYVTRTALQRRYPCGRGAFGVSDVALPPLAFITSFSSVQLDRHAFGAPGDRASRTGRFNMIFVGSLDQLYKGPDVLIEAVAQNVNAGVDLGVTWIGDGKHRASLESRCLALGLSDRMRFCGTLPAGEAIREELDAAHMFVLPSRQEGLPRAMIEAMARGLPCIGTTVGGVPELLPEEDLVPPGDASALARKIREVMTDPARMRRMSGRNFQVATEYREELLRERRIAFYDYVRERTRTWSTARGKS